MAKNQIDNLDPVHQDLLCTILFCLLTITCVPVHLLASPYFLASPYCYCTFGDMSIQLFMVQCIFNSLTTEDWDSK